MKRVIVVILLMFVNANAFAQSFKSRPEYEVVYADSMFNYISKAIPVGWSVKRFDRRLVISRKDSVYLEFSTPLNSPYDFDSDTTDFYHSYPKYRFEIYVDIPLENWTDSTWTYCKKHNDSINFLIEREVHKSREVPVADQMREYERKEIRLCFLYAQLINIPVAITNWFGIYISDNRPRGCFAFDIHAEGKGRDAYHIAIGREIDSMKEVCTKAIKAHLNIQYKY